MNESTPPRPPTMGLLALPAVIWRPASAPLRTNRRRLSAILGRRASRRAEARERRRDR